MKVKLTGNQVSFIYWLVHVSGAIGIVSPFRDWFLILSPLNLLISFLLLFRLEDAKQKGLQYIVVLSFIVGITVEYLGVNHGLIFGEYEYGQNLGSKIFGVPIMIGINWAMLVIITNRISKSIVTNKWVVAILASALMVALDVLIEIVAPQIDFWYWENNVVPFKNYVGWAGTALVLHIAMVHLKTEVSLKKSLHLFLAQVFFFAFLSIAL